MEIKKPSSEEVKAVYQRLAKDYPDTRTELTYEGPFQLLVAVILSAQCTDARVNLTTPSLFRRFPDAKTMAKADAAEVEKLIHSCGFFRQKTKSILSASKDLVERYAGNVPRTLDELVTLAGVGRKTASVVLNQAFDEPAIAVDTHVKRVSHRLGWAHHLHPEKIEAELKECLPPQWWSAVNGMLILHGRRVCKSQKPLCQNCVVREYCVYFAGQRKAGIRDETGRLVVAKSKRPRSQDVRGKGTDSGDRPGRGNNRKARKRARPSRAGK